MAQFPNRAASRAHYGVATALKKIVALTTRVTTLESRITTNGPAKIAGKPVTVTSLATNDVLKYNGTAWVNAPDAT